MNKDPGAWAMRGPQNKLHFYPSLRSDITIFSARAICGAKDPSFAYSVTITPPANNCCGRCLKQRGGPK